jgi:thiol reductant ABC exporter CydD subunit
MASQDVPADPLHPEAMMSRVRTLDPRLLHYARSTRRFLVLTVLLGVASAVLVIAQAWLLALLVSGAFVDGDGLDLLRGPLVALAGVVLARAALAWLSEAAAERAGARAKSELRGQLLTRAAELGPDGLGRSTGDLVTLATRGVDALDGYYSRYLPQLVLAVVVPVAVLVVLLGTDVLSAVIVAVTLPLIPVFMALIGMATRARTDRQLRTLQRLAGHFLDVVAGLPTLKIFGRAKAQARVILEVTDTYRRRTMSTLRLAFVSSLVLELLAMLSVALVAVSVGLRLVGSDVTFRTALFVLVLAPEAYLPLRQLGTTFHASAEGLAAAEQVFEVLAEPLPVRGTRTDVPDPALSTLEVSSLTVGYPGRGAPALDGVDLVVEPGTVLALTGQSGCGKSTLLGVLLGLVRPASGQVTVGGVGLDTLDPDAWRRRIAWVPQRPYLFAGSLEANVRLGDPHATTDAVTAAVAAAGLTAMVARLPAGLSTPLGEGGAGLSAGERQRVALARAFLRDAPLLLLDEPTASLDGGTEAEVVAAVRRLAAGRTVVLVAHRPALVALADRVVRLPGPARDDEPLVDAVTA